MKNAILLSIVFWTLLSCCNSKKIVSQDNENNKGQILTPCPENTECTLEVFQNKSLVIKTDEMGSIYYELEDQPGKMIYHYTYNQKSDKQYQDAGYREEIIFELNSTSSDLKLANEAIQDTKLIFGAWCYCKGKAGNYKITKGNFSKKENEISIDFPPVVNDQKITELKIKI